MYNKQTGLVLFVIITTLIDVNTGCLTSNLPSRRCNLVLQEVALEYSCFDYKSNPVTLNHMYGLVIDWEEN